MNKSIAVRLKCLECSGKSPKEVTLCHIADCPLWSFRFGYSIKDKRYRKRIEAAKKNYSKDYQEMLKLVSEYISEQPISPKIAQIRAILEGTI